MEPKVSVVLPVYNAEKYLSQAIESILNQTFKDFEFIIINDGSIDNSKQIIQSYSDERIKYFENDGNKGIIYTLNRGIELAQGEYIARMDADDISMPERFEKQVQYMEANPQCIACGTALQWFMDNKDIKTKAHYLTDDKALKDFLVINSCFAHPSVFIRRKTLIENNLRYDYNYRHAEDYKLWTDLAL